MGNYVELLGYYGGDLTHAMSAWTSTSRDLTEEKKARIPGLLKYLAENGHHTPFEKSFLHFLVRCDTASHIHILKHRAGVCLAGDTEIWTETISPRSGRMIRKRKIEDLYRNWHFGVIDKAHVRIGRKGGLSETITERQRLLPSCRNQSVRILNEETGLFELGIIDNIYENDIQEVIEVVTAKGYRVKCSRDHLIYTRRGWVKAGELTMLDEIAVNGKCNPNSDFVYKRLRESIGAWTRMQRNRLIRPEDICYKCGGAFDRADLELDHIIPVSHNIGLALHDDNLAPICLPCHLVKTSQEQGVRLGTVAGANYSKLEYLPFTVDECVTYDLSIQGPWKGFIGNGIVVHNSVNAESARYRELNETFYIPEDWPPKLQTKLRKFNEKAAKHYHQTVGELEVRFGRKRAKEAARFFLPYANQLNLDVSFNFRSFMWFQGLRNKEDAQLEISTIAQEMLDLIRDTGAFEHSLKGFGYGSS